MAQVHPNGSRGGTEAADDLERAVLEALQDEEEGEDPEQPRGAAAATAATTTTMDLAKIVKKIVKAEKLKWEKEKEMEIKKKEKEDKKKKIQELKEEAEEKRLEMELNLAKTQLEQLTAAGKGGKGKPPKPQWRTPPYYSIGQLGLQSLPQRYPLSLPNSPKKFFLRNCPAASDSLIPSEPKSVRLALASRDGHLASRGQFLPSRGQDGPISPSDGQPVPSGAQASWGSPPSSRQPGAKRGHEPRKRLTRAGLLFSSTTDFQGAMPGGGSPPQHAAAD